MTGEIASRPSGLLDGTRCLVEDAGGECLGALDQLLSDSWRGWLPCRLAQYMPQRVRGGARDALGHSGWGCGIAGVRVRVSVSVRVRVTMGVWLCEGRHLKQLQRDLLRKFRQQRSLLLPVGLGSAVMLVHRQSHASGVRCCMTYRRSWGPIAITMAAPQKTPRLTEWRRGAGAPCTSRTEG